MEEDTKEILGRTNAGDRDVTSQLFSRVYGDLRVLADRYLRRVRADDVLQPTAVLHEAFLRIVRGKDMRWKSREHFFACAAQAMRHVLSDHARNQHAQKRGGQEWRQIPLDESVSVAKSDTVDVLMLDETLARLSLISERQANIVKFRIFGGLSTEEIATLLDVAPTTVKADWRAAKSWLRRELAGARTD